MEPARLRASPEQFSALIEYMERHGDLARPQTGSQGRLRADRLWQELTSLLNSIGGGVEKTQDKWKKVWADWKTKTKKKYSLIRRHASGTGGGPSSRQTLTALEERVVAIIGVTAVIGQAGIQEQGFNIQSQINEDPITEDERNELEICDINLTQPPSTLLLGPEATTSTQSPPLQTSLPSADRQAPLSLQTIESPRRQRLLRAQRTPGLTPSDRGARVSGPEASVSTFPSLSRTPLPNTDRQATPSPQTVAETPRRQRLLRARRNRGLTPFDRAASEFVAVEQSRLRLEETRDRRMHEREMERLRLEALRIEVTREQNELLGQLAVIAQGLLQTLSHNSSLPSTVVIPDTERNDNC